MTGETFPEISDAFLNLADWRSRGYIPHFNRPGLIQLITFRLHDAVPEKLIDQWKRELRWTPGIRANDPRQIALRLRIEKYEDAGRGSCWLRDEKIARITEQAMLFYNHERYRVIAWCIMPNHVHVIVEIPGRNTLESILHSWKSYVAHKANKVLLRTGKFWFPEYHDRFIRNAEHLQRAVEYVENNPVRAGLVTKKEEWRWSSAYRRNM
jgi:putative transposase